MKAIEPGRVYLIEGEQIVSFTAWEDGKVIDLGTTNEELIELLIDRITFQNNKLGCFENIAAIGHLGGALHFLQQRQKARAEQNVTHTEEPHVSEEPKKYCLCKTSRVYCGGPAPRQDLIADTLEAAIALAEAQDNPVGYDVYLMAPIRPDAYHPVWEYHDRDSLKRAVDQIDPLHDGVE